MLQINQPPSFVMPMHRHENARAVLIFSGTISDTGLSGRGMFESGDFVFHPPLHLHANRGSATPARYLQLSVSTAGWRDVARRYGWRSLRGKIDLREWSVSDLSRRQFGGDALLTHLFLSEDSKPAAHAHDAALDAFACDLRDGDNQDLHISRRAEEMGLRPYQLTRAFAKRFGLPPSVFRREARLQRSLWRLVKGDNGLANIAASCGFSDQSHFTREVVRATGKTPRRLQRQFEAA